MNKHLKNYQAEGKNNMTHENQCSIYLSQSHIIPEAGICTCGYGLTVLQNRGSYQEMYSQKRKLEIVERLTNLRTENRCNTMIRRLEDRTKDFLPNFGGTENAR